MSTWDLEKYNSTRINDIAIAMSYSSRADPGSGI